MLLRSRGKLASEERARKERWRTSALTGKPVLGSGRTETVDAAVVGFVACSFNERLQSLEWRCRAMTLKLSFFLAIDVFQIVCLLAISAIIV